MLKYEVEERVTEIDDKFYPEIHVWTNGIHIYGYRPEIWFACWSDAKTTAHLFGIEELNKIKQFIQRFINKNKIS